MVIDLILINLILIYGLDISGFIQELEIGLAKWLKVKEITIPKPFSCSTCMTFWCGLLYLLIANSFTLPWIGFVCLLSFMSRTVSQILMTIRDVINEYINYFQRWFF